MKFLFITLAIIAVCDGLKILNIFPTISKSHDNLGKGINMHLLKAGHEVTYMTTFTKKDSQHPKLRQIDISENMNVLPESKRNESSFKTQSWISYEIVMAGMHILTTMTIENENVQKLLHDPNEHFDVVIVDWMFNDIVFSGIFYFFDSRAYNNLIAPIIKARGKEPPAPQELRFNASLFLSNSHVSFGEATRLPINYIPVGGFHIREDVKPLPENIKKILDKAKDGVIYFSLGSLIQSKDLTDEVKRSLVNMFGTLKQTVIWKFEEELENLPKNLHILKWAPQQSILNHPNCILFITQGGILSITEAIHFAVPVVGIPVFADQFANIGKAVVKGFAKKVEMIMSSVVADNLKEAIVEVLTNPKYREKIQEISYIFHHRPVKPGAELVHWVEHVVKTRGAPHMRSPALKVSWYQKMYLDLAAVIVLIVLALRFIYRKIRGSKKVVSAKKKN